MSGEWLRIEGDLGLTGCFTNRGGNCPKRPLRLDAEPPDAHTLQVGEHASSREPCLEGSKRPEPLLDIRRERARHGLRLFAEEGEGDVRLAGSRPTRPWKRAAKRRDETFHFAGHPVRERHGDEEAGHGRSGAEGLRGREQLVKHERRPLAPKTLGPSAP